MRDGLGGGKGYCVFPNLWNFLFKHKVFKHICLLIHQESKEEGITDLKNTWSFRALTSNAFQPFCLILRTGRLKKEGRYLAMVEWNRHLVPSPSYVPKPHHQGEDGHPLCNKQTRLSHLPSISFIPKMMLARPNKKSQLLRDGHHF